MTTRELTCIGCPMGCSLSVEMSGNVVVHVEGNTCPRGESYAKNEVTNPMRVVTTTVRTDGREMLSVKTAREVPKGKIMDVVRSLKDIRVETPVHIGDVVAANAADTGVEVIATKELL